MKAEVVESQTGRRRSQVAVPLEQQMAAAMSMTFEHCRAEGKDWITARQF